MNRSRVEKLKKRWEELKKVEKSLPFEIEEAKIEAEKRRLERIRTILGYKKDGLNNVQIGKKLGITRQRVKQILDEVAKK